MNSVFPQDALAPTPIKIPHEMTLHGDRRSDPFYWIKERDTERVLDYLKSENAYYERMTKEWEPLQERLFSEMKARVKQDDSSPPAKHGAYEYYTRFASGLEYPIFCRKISGPVSSPSGSEEIILDVNQIAQGHKYTSVSGVRPSPDHSMIVYGVDFIGRRFYDLYFKDLKTGKTLTHMIPKTTSNVVWAEDGHTLFYTLQNPETLRSEKVLRFDLNSGLSTEVYYEKDEIFSVSVGKSQNDKYIFINSGSFDSSEVRFVSASKPTAELSLFSAREPKHEYSIEDGDDGFYILTNWKAENFRIMKTDPKQTSKENWKDLVPHRTDVLISDMLMLKRQLVLEVRRGGLSQLEVFDRGTYKGSVVQFPDAAYVVSLGTNYEYDTDHVRFDYESMVRPDSVYDYDFKTGTSTLVKIKEVPTYDASKYQSERIWATAADGAKIPISLVYRIDKRRTDKSQPSGNPLMVYAYGSYGLSMDPNFRPSVFSLLDRGFVYAIAHIRGGSEMGRDWYEKGRMGFKKNTFTDFISATEHLVKHGYGDPTRVFASGGSAGGLLMGTVANLRPDLYRGIVSVVPFVDVLTTMLDPDIPLTTSEYEQWGNPNDRESYFYMKSYSPYDNIAPKPYPATLVMTGYHDSQVQYWEPAKYVAKLREATTSNLPVLFRIDMEAGHAGASGRFQALKDTAAQFAFLIKFANVD